MNTFPRTLAMDTVEDFTKVLERSEKERAEAVSKLAEASTVFDQTAISVIMVADAKIRLIGQVLNAVDYRRANEDEDVLEEVLVREVVEHYTTPEARRVFSRSTSLLDNLAEDVMEMVKADLRETAL